MSQELGKNEKKGDYPVVALLRVSSLQQSEVQHGSLEQQKNAIIKKIKEEAERTGKNYYILEFVEEDAGVSAKFQNTENRKDLRRIEELVKSGRIKAFWADRIDRVARDTVYSLQLLRLLNLHGVEFHTVADGEISYQRQDQRFGYIYNSYMAEIYSENLSKNVRTQGRRARMNNGKDSNTSIVFGLDPHPTLSCMYVPNQVEAEQLNMLGWYAVKHGYEVAAKYGNSLGIRTKIKTIREKISREGIKIPPRLIGGKPLTGKILERMLTCPKVWGVNKFKDDLNEYKEKQNEHGEVEWKYAHGPILEAELIEELKKIQKENRKHVPTDMDAFLLSGVLETEDGATYCGDSTKKGGKKKYTFYNSKKTSVASIKRLNAASIEGDILSRLKEYLKENSVFRRLVESGKMVTDKRMQKFDNEIGELKTKEKNLNEQLEKFSGKISQLVLSDSDDFQDALLVLKEEKSNVEYELNLLKEGIKKLMEERSKFVTQRGPEVCDKRFLDKLQSLFSMFDELPNRDKKQFLKSVCPKIIVHSNFRIEMKVNPIFYEEMKPLSIEAGVDENSSKKWLGRRDSNSRPTD
jgi:DNA invertase Pin-like site-specific DNA recombinase